jgi:hypothetical protein
MAVVFVPFSIPGRNSMTGETQIQLLHGDEHKPERWYTECDCVHPDDLLEPVSDAEYQRVVDEFEDAHVALEDGDDDLGLGCDKSYTYTRCSTCSTRGDYPDVPWPCARSLLVEGVSK